MNSSFKNILPHRPGKNEKSSEDRSFPV